MRSTLLGLLLAVPALSAPALLGSDPFGSARAAGIELSLPIACEPGRTCLVQNLPDLDPGPGRLDAFCGQASYDGHKGTDFRVADEAAMRAGVDVLAAAPGTVLRLRDGLADDGRFPQGQDCGNGLVIDHGGWTTQYCHLAQGSLAVREGERVEREQPIGRVGRSGSAEFPHVHMTLRRGREVVDPATGEGLDAGSASCDVTVQGDSLWDERARVALRDGRTAALASGFAAGAVKGADVQAGRVAAPDGAGPLVFYAQFMNMVPGDRIALSIRGPDGTWVENVTEPLAGHKATYTAFTGRRTPPPPGRYTGTAKLMRGETTVAETSAEISL